MRSTTDAPRPERAPEDFIRELMENNPPEDNFYNRAVTMFSSIAHIVLEASLTKSGHALHVVFNNELVLRIVVDDPNLQMLHEFKFDPQWRNYTVNGEFVGNLWGMQRYVAELCAKEFMSELGKTIMSTWR
jgi:hypothetical protein